tara:strand:- start:529 stop:1290 length:762 start_codon:yes stop_codon:yes gene_type:complete
MKRILMLVVALMAFAPVVVEAQEVFDLPASEDLLSIIVLIGIGLLAFRGWLSDRQRTKKLSNLAEQMRMKFSKRGNNKLSGALSGLDLGNAATATENVLHGDSGQLGYEDKFQVWVADYMQQSGKKKILRQTVILFRSPELSLPQFSMRPENLANKIAFRFYHGYQDIDFEYHRVGAEFSKKYLLGGAVESKVRTLFTDKVLTFFTTHPDKLCVAGLGGKLILYRPAQSIKPENIAAFMEEGLEVFRLFAKQD